MGYNRQLAHPCLHQMVGVIYVGYTGIMANHSIWKSAGEQPEPGLREFRGPPANRLRGIPFCIQVTQETLFNVTLGTSL